MEIIKIGSHAMKISLCTNEVKEYGLENDQGVEFLRNNFNKLILNVKNAFNYQVLDDKIVGEYFSGKDGGCEIFVSRVEAQDRVYRDRVQDDFVKKQRTIPTAYSFDCLEKLLMVVKRLNDISYLGTSSAYYDDVKNKFYLFLDDVSIKDLKYAFISEYARQIKGDGFLHIKEHFKCICRKDAIKQLSF